MRKITLLFAGMLAIMASAQTVNDAKLKVSIVKDIKHNLVVCNILGDKEILDTLKAGTDGTYIAQYALSKPSDGYLHIIDGKADSSFCLSFEPGKSLDVSVVKDGDGKLTASYGGDTGNKSAYNNLLRTAYTLSDTFTEKKMKEFHSFKDWAEYIDAQHKKFYDALDKVNDKDFVRKQKEGLEEGKSGFYFNYATMQQLNGHDMKKDSQFMDYIKTINLNDTAQIRAISEYLGWYIIAYPDDPKLPDGALRLRALGKLVQNQDVKNRVADLTLSMQYMAMMFGADMSATLPQVYREFLKVSTDSVQLAKVRSKLSELEYQQTGSEAYAIPLHDIKGNKTTLKDIVGGGKYTYIDFWATWCGPCRKETPHFARLAAQFKNSKVRFVSISLDENLGKWETMVKAENPAWPQYRIPKESQNLCGNIYGITGIPRFMIFDKEGRLLKSSAPRPSEKEAEVFLNSIK